MVIVGYENVPPHFEKKVKSSILWHIIGKVYLPYKYLSLDKGSTTSLAKMEDNQS